MPTTSLVQLPGGQLASEAALNSVSELMPGSTSDPLSDSRQSQPNRTVKRKPVANTETVYTQNTFSSARNTLLVENVEQAVQQSLPSSQAFREPLTLPCEEYSSLSSATTLVADSNATTASAQIYVNRPVVYSDTRSLSTNALRQTPEADSIANPQLRHAQTAPQTVWQNTDSNGIEGCSITQAPRRKSMPKLSDRRKSASQVWSSSLETGRKLGTSSFEMGKKLGSSSLETGKKVARNKYVRAGVKYTANLALGIVVNSVIAEVTNSRNGNDGEGSDNGGPGFLDQLFNSNNNDNDNNDTTASDANSDPQASQGDVNSWISPEPGTPTSTSIDGVGCDAASFSNMDNSNDAMANSFLLQLQQQQPAMGLNGYMALQQPSAALAALPQSAIQQSQQIQSDEQFNASSDLDWGTDAAVPDVMANTYNYSSSAATGSGWSNLGAGLQQQQQRLANMSAAV